MSLPATDNFDRASLGSNWTTVDGTPTIDSNEAAGGSIDSNFATWNPDTFNDNQYGVATNANGAAANCGPTTRSAATRGYLLLGTLSDIKLYRLDGNEGFTVLQTVSVTGVSDGSVLRLESEGATHRSYLAGVQVGTDHNDATYTSGAAGFFLYGLSPRLDDWEGGNLAAPVVDTSALVQTLKFRNNLRPRAFAPGIAR